MEIPCRVCGVPVIGGNLCDACGVTWEPFAGEKQTWRDICPEEYLDTDPKDPRICELVNRVTMSASQVKGSAGVGIVGRRGSGKTRAALWTIHNRYPRIHPIIVNHVDLGMMATDATGGINGATRQEARQMLAQYARCWLLMIDDIGKAASTERSTEALYAIMEDRTSAKLPTWWTSEWGGDELARKLGERGPAIVRRLGEFSAIVTV